MDPVYSQFDNFEIYAESENGEVVNINTGFREYKTWERNGDLLILTGITTGYSSEKFVDTNNIISLSDSVLVIGQDGYKVTYHRK